MRYLLLGMVFVLAGCESMPRGEWAYQGLHAVDVMQTLNGPARDDCYDEVSPVHRRIMGEKPSQSDVLLWGVGMGLAHYGISSYIEENYSGFTLGVWQAITTGGVAITIGESYKIGVRPFGDNDHSKLSGNCAPKQADTSDSDVPLRVY